jgi:hypothetical protein
LIPWKDKGYQLGDNMNLVDILFVAVFLLLITVIVITYQLRLKLKLIKEFAISLQKYQGIIDIESETTKRKKEYDDLVYKINNIDKQYNDKNSVLNEEYLKHKAIYDNLCKEINLLEENLEYISYGLYKPHYDFGTSQEYSAKLDDIISKQKQTIKDELATHCATKWTVGGSDAQGARMTKLYSKLMLRAFNGECDATISRVKWNNIGNMEARIIKAIEAINKLGTVHQITITHDYYNLKLQELRLAYELQEKLNAEKEEQRSIREQRREEEKALREIERAQRDAQEDEERSEKALKIAKSEIEKTQGVELDLLKEKIKILEENLRQAREMKERAISQAQLTKSGHVYIISNIGSFGDSVYKIGMTRRLEPMDRVYELGDASVPFDFDVHAMIYSENAPELENNLHKKLEQKRINLIDQRAEFYKTSIDEIESLIKEMNLDIKLTKIAEAKEFRESLSIIEAKRSNNDKIVKESRPNLFPDTLI